MFYGKNTNFKAFLTMQKAADRSNSHTSENNLVT